MRPSLPATESPAALHPPPYVPAERTLAEVTVLAVLLGAILSVVMAAANAYLGLKAGITVTASIPAAVISVALLKGVLRRGTILENNIVQTMASTGESLAAGVIFTVPALVMIGEWQSFRFWPTTLITLLGGLIGILFMVPMRRALIVDRPDLTYPEGVACSEVLITGEEGGAGVKAIAWGMALGAFFKVLVSGVRVVQSTVQGAFAAGRSIFYFGADLSPALLAVGYIVNLQIASLVFLGGALGWIVALPLLGGYEAGLSAIDAADEIWSSQIRYLGVGAMLVGGLHSVWSVRSGLVAGVVSLRDVGGKRGRQKAVPRTERNLPLAGLLWLFLLTTFGTLLFYDHLVGNMAIAAVTTAMMVVTSFVFVAVATYIAGVVGSSNSPVSGMTICALLITAGVFLAVGIRGDSAILATLGVAGVVCCATCTSGDIAQDLKTGLLVGATPAKQQLTEVIAAVVPAFFFAPILAFLHASYGIGTGGPESLPAPQAGLFASLTEGFFGGGELPWTMVFVGAALGATLIVADRPLAARNSAFRLHVMPVAVGIYLPFAIAIPILIGGLLRHFLSRRRADASMARDSGILFGSGLIAGEAVMAIVLAVFIYYEVGLPYTLVDHWLPSAAIFAALVAVFWGVARRRLELP